MDFKKHSTVHGDEQEGIEVTIGTFWINFQHKTRKTKKERDKDTARWWGIVDSKGIENDQPSRDIVRGQC